MITKHNSIRIELFFFLFSNAHLPRQTMHIAIAGNIGSGKTTLTTLLSKHYKYTPHFEEVDNNPYLKRHAALVFQSTGIFFKKSF